MNEIDIRIECLRMAQMQCPATPTEYLVGEAEKLYQFVKNGRVLGASALMEEAKS